MGLCLIAQIDLTFIGVILQVAVALGMVIFVHELGHFVVAKLCGVKCEKFYLGFDIAGLRFFRFRWGETEYGIGILPLGGYVKMLGQEDNPARLQEEIERAKQMSVAAAATASGAAPSLAAALSPAELAAAETALYDPRSYLAKSVPQRIAIISAGVVMNVIFAFVAAIWAYGIGVEKSPSIIGVVAPGYPAWRAGILPGDRIIRIGDREIDNFEQVSAGIGLGENVRNGVKVVVRRDDGAAPLTFHLVPDFSGLKPIIGVGPSRSLELAGKRPVAIPDSPAAKADPPLAPGDRIIAVDGRSVRSLAEAEAIFSQLPSKPLALTVERKTGRETVQVTTTLAPAPMRELGLRMTMGAIVGIEKDSPAEACGLKAGDRLLAVDGEAIENPLRLPEMLRERAGRTVQLAVERGQPASKIEVEATLRHVTMADVPLGKAAAASDVLKAPILGVAYTVENTVASVAAESPAAKAGITPGEIVTAAKLTLPPIDAASAEQPKEIAIPLGENRKEWPAVSLLLQDGPPGMKVVLSVAGPKGKGERTVELQPVPAVDWFSDNRGLILEPARFEVPVHGLLDAVMLGSREATGDLLMVVSVLKKIGSGEISARGLGGPITIARQAGMSAYEGFARLLLFVAFISANLAVLNILPIPVLDGGHLVFLIYEGVRGKPADERVQVALTYVGLGLLLLLMTWVFGLDLGIVPRELSTSSITIAA